jgi:hypothetical protein
MPNTVVSYPIPAYANVPIRPQYYSPRRFVISGITLGITTIVMTSVVQNYVPGQQIRLIFPSKYGCQQLNGKQGLVIAVLSGNSVELDINSTQVDPFIPTPNFLTFQPQTPPQVLAIGDVNSGANGPIIPYYEFTHISGSFINISPK